MTPLEVPDRTLMLTQTHYVLSRLWRPNQYLMVICGRTCKQMSLLIPFDAFNGALMSLPDLLRYLWHVNCPQEDFRTTCSSQTSIVLPGDIHDLPRLNESILCFLLDRIWIPHKDIGFISTRCHKCVRFVPTRYNKRTLRTEETL